MAQNVVGSAHVRLDRRDRVGVGQQRPAVGDRHRVVVDVDDPGGRSDRQGDLVDVALGGQAGADVEELPDPHVGEEPDGAAQGTRRANQAYGW